MSPETTRVVCFIAHLILWFLAIMEILLVILIFLVRAMIMFIKTFIKAVEPEAADLYTPEETFNTPTETTYQNDTTVDPSPIDSYTPSILPSAITNPITDSSTSVSFTGQSFPINATVDPSPIDSNMPSILPSANIEPPIRTGPPRVVNVSSFRKTDIVKMVGSVKQCKEKINAMFNTICERNLQTKCKELKEIIDGSEQKCLPWLARYIVTERISTELNNQQIYLTFLNTLNNEKLLELITLETETYIKEILSRDNVSPTYRKTLNNLGSWYGMLTLARNKHINPTFDLKLLLMKAYREGEQKLIYTLPLVTRILEKCANSTVFNTSSPWTLDVLFCLSELHQQPNLKLTLQFEIEILLKKLKIDLKDLTPTTRFFVENT